MTDGWCRGALTRGAIGVVSLVLASLVAAPFVGLAAAETAPEWHLAPLPEPVLQLETPANGQFFATTNGGRYRSDDAGVSWSPAPWNLPPGLRTLAVDPLDPAISYANGPDGLFKTVDGGGTWSLILASAPGVPRLAISPADHNLLYLALGGSPSAASYLRSRDGGASWEPPLTDDGGRNSPCSYEIDLLQFHPTDPSRLFRSAGCFAGRDFGHPLAESRDQGVSWSQLFRPQVGFPQQLIGGQGTNPSRFYLLAHHGMATYSVIFRSDDDGLSWSKIYELEGAKAPVQPGDPPPTIGAIAYDPCNPERVYLGLGGGQSGVQISSDGGQTWAPLGRQDLGPVKDLALGFDGLNLYAATDRGVWRISRH
jgi:photosystem II stability/assembly factor-like uncharacterized protein